MGTWGEERDGWEWTMERCQEPSVVASQYDVISVSAAPLLIISRMPEVAVLATIKSRWGQDHRDEMKPAAPYRQRSCDQSIHRLGPNRPLTKL